MTYKDDLITKELYDTYRRKLSACNDVCTGASFKEYYVKIDADSMGKLHIRREMENNKRLFNDSIIKKVIFNGPATIVIWADGSKTVVKLMEKDYYDPEKAVMMCVMEKMLGSKGNVKRFFNKWVPEATVEELDRYRDVIKDIGPKISTIAQGVAKVFENMFNPLNEEEKKENKND